MFVVLAFITLYDSFTIFGLMIGKSHIAATDTMLIQHVFFSYPKFLILALGTC